MNGDRAYATTLRCPVLDCTWTEDVPGPDPRALESGTLAGVFGTGVLAAAAVAMHSNRTEAILERHFRTHSLVDYVRTMSAQRQALITFEDSLSAAESDATAFRRALEEIGQALQLDRLPNTRLPGGVGRLSTWSGRAVAEVMRRDHRRPSRTSDRTER